MRSIPTAEHELKGVEPSRLISAAVWVSVKNRKRGGTKVFSATMADIDRALRVRVYTDPKTRLP